MSGSRQFCSLGRLKYRLRVLPLSLSSSCVTRKITPRKNCPREFLWARSFISQDFARPYFSRRLIKYCLFEAIMSRSYRCPKFTVQLDGPAKPCRLIVLILRTQITTNWDLLLSLPSPTVSRISARSHHHLRPRYPTRTSLALYSACSQIEWMISGRLLRVVENFNFNPGDRVRKVYGLLKAERIVVFSAVSRAKTLECFQQWNRSSK